MNKQMNKFKQKAADAADTIQDKAQDLKNSVKDQNDEALLGRELTADLDTPDGEKHIPVKGSRITPRILERIKAHHMRQQAFSNSQSV